MKLTITLLLILVMYSILCLTGCQEECKKHDWGLWVEDKGSQNAYLVRWCKQCKVSDEVKW